MIKRPIFKILNNRNIYKRLCCFSFVIKFKPNRAFLWTRDTFKKMRQYMVQAHKIGQRKNCCRRKSKPFKFLVCFNFQGTSQTFNWNKNFAWKDNKEQNLGTVPDYQSIFVNCVSQLQLDPHPHSDITVKFFNFFKTVICHPKVYI